MKDPAPAVVLDKLADSSVQVAMRVWVDGADYWNVLYDMNERVYKEFGKYGLSFPVPKMNVNITQR